MKVYNLDKFKDAASVEIGGRSYSIRGINVKEYLSGEVTSKIESAPDDKGKVVAMVEAIQRMSDIPRDILEEQTFSALRALIVIMQGGDPEAQEGAAADSKK